VAESLIAAQNANEEELALLEEETDDTGASSVSQTHSLRASACLEDPTESSASTDPRRQFQNLVHMWAENGESFTSVTDGKLSQSRFNNNGNKRRTVQVEYVPPRSKIQGGETNHKAAAPAASKLSGSEPISTEPIAGEVVKSTKFPYRTKAIYSRRAEDPREISFSQNEILEVSHIGVTRWWKARRENGDTGYVPSNHLIVL